METVFHKFTKQKKSRSFPYLTMLSHWNKDIGQDIRTKLPWRQATTSLSSYLGEGTKVSRESETTSTAESFFSNQLMLKYPRSQFL